MVRMKLGDDNGGGGGVVVEIKGRNGNERE